MSIYYRFKSTKEFRQLQIGGPCITVKCLKQLGKLKGLWGGTDFDLLVDNAQTNQEYINDESVIESNASVILRRVSCPRFPIKVVELQKPISSQVKNHRDVVAVQDDNAKVQAHELKRDQASPPAYDIGHIAATRDRRDEMPGLCSPFCKQFMIDAVFARKCCFRSFCDKCIRDSNSAKSMCVCGATNIGEDDIIPNITLRKIIVRLVDSPTSTNSAISEQNFSGNSSPDQWMSMPPLAAHQRSDESTQIIVEDSISEEMQAESVPVYDFFLPGLGAEAEPFVAQCQIMMSSLLPTTTDLSEFAVDTRRSSEQTDSSRKRKYLEPSLDQT